MTRDDFLFRFHLHKVSQSCHNYQHHSPLKPAAVLIGLIDNKDSTDSNNSNKLESTGLQVLLTKRASHLKHHPSQISFPGGKVEPNDKCLVTTALREAQEEIGLSPQAVTVIGQLPAYETISGYHVTPIIAIIAKGQRYKKDNNEVAEIFQVPLTHFLSQKNHHTVTGSRNGQNLNIHFMPYKHYNIWGATASMLKDLVNQLSV
ncbi:MAG: CoA pyrophosphatase [Colwellia sp.]